MKKYIFFVVAFLLGASLATTFFAVAETVLPNDLPTVVCPTPVTPEEKPRMMPGEVPEEYDNFEDVCIGTDCGQPRPPHIPKVRDPRYIRPPMKIKTGNM